MNRRDDTATATAAVHSGQNMDRFDDTATTAAVHLGAVHPVMLSCPTPISLAWKDLTISVKGGRHVVLDKVTGFANPGRLLAVLGPSGCGKTTLLETLAGRRANSTLQAGRILVNGREEKLAFGKTAAYVTQDDTLIGTLSVMETIWYSACLRFPDGMAQSEKLGKMESAILEMGLHDARNTRVGSWGVKGLSGGEKRRLSIALEILTRPNVLFLDEPTSGLDSAAAYFVIQRLRDLAKDGHTVLAVVHQPSSEIFQLCHDLLLLSGGRTVYFGKAARAPEFFASAGYPCPPLQNPSDHYIRCINKDFDSVRMDNIAIQKAKKSNSARFSDLEYDEEALSLGLGLGMGIGIGMGQQQDSTDLLDESVIISHVVEKLISLYQASEQARVTADKIERISEQARVSGDLQRKMYPEPARGDNSSLSSFKMQLYTLTRRSFTNMWRDWSYYWVRFMMYIALALFVGYVYFNQSYNYQSINGRAYCLSFVVGFLTFMSIGGFPAFIEDMKVFTRERQNGHYGVMPFIMANTLSSLPFLLLIAVGSSAISYSMARLHPGFAHYLFYSMIVFASLVVVESLMMAVAGIVPNFLMGIIVGASIMGALLLVSGFYRLPYEIPNVITKYPLYYANFFNYAMQGMFKNEFTGKTFEGQNPGSEVITGDYILRVMFQMSVGRSKWVDFAILCSNVIAYRFIFFLLIKGRERFRFP